MEECDDALRLIFPVGAKWTYLLPIVVSTLIGLANVAAAIAVLAAVRHLNALAVGRAPLIGVIPMRQAASQVLIPAGIGALFLWLSAAHDWWMYRRWGRVPRTLTLNGESLVLSRLLWGRIREKTWPAGDITAIELRRVKFNLSRKRTVSDLRIYRRRGSALHFRLSSSDSKLGGEIARQLSRVLGFSRRRDYPQSVRYE